jgi:hypothetical protein
MRWWRQVSGQFSSRWGSERKRAEGRLGRINDGLAGFWGLLRKSLGPLVRGKKNGDVGDWMEQFSVETPLGLLPMTWLHDGKGSRVGNSAKTPIFPIF